ncbi:MAG: ferritin-like domain-containing protein [Pirellula sp.]|nr:ferritin-like domain-containing protein [Pirellula sp.]
MTLHDFFVAELQDLFSAEQQLLDALPKMAQAATSRSLRKAFLTHRRETVGQVKRLRKVFHLIKVKPGEKTCKAMKGLLAEGDEWMHENAEPGVKDVGLIAAAQRVEHYEIAGYGCVRTYAELLGHAQAAKLLQATLDEEGAADKKLTDLATRLNVRAAPEPIEDTARPRRKAR